MIGLDVISDPMWMGGIIYLRNLVYCLSILPEDERPEVRLLGVPDDTMPLAVELRSFAFVDRGVKAARRQSRITHLWKRVHRRFLQRFLHQDPRWRALDATYPTFGGKIEGAAGIRWIPDFQHMRMPQFFTDEERKARDKGIAWIAGQKGVLVLSSAAARRDFEALCPDATIEPIVWHFCSVITDYEKGGADPHEKYGLPRRYVYIPNQFWAHKNHEVAFRALQRLASQGSDAVMVCTGREEDYRNAGHMAAMLSLIAESGLDTRVKRLGLVPRSDQIEIFRHATLVLQPSLFEGWSTIVEDAKTIGRPVIASDIEVHREQFAVEPEAWVRFFPARDHAALAGLLGDAWRELPAGPDAGSEARAERRSRLRQFTAAREFMAIVARAASIECGAAA